MDRTTLITGGAGFIGANFIRWCLQDEVGRVVNIDKFTYAAIADNVAGLDANPRYVLVRGDIGDLATVSQVLKKYQPSTIINFAAATHVDRSIHEPAEFVSNNVVGTFMLLEAARAFWMGLSPERRSAFRYLQVSTDEVYGTLKPDDLPFEECSPCNPNSPYAASKAAADHIVRSYYQTYGVPVLIARCGNNFGPCQYPEKLVPLAILRATRGEPIPIYGDGTQVRDWVYVKDHCSALRRIVALGRPGEVYNVGAGSQRTNLEVVRAICGLVDELCWPHEQPRTSLITHVADRPGHDRRYAINASKLRRELGWKPEETFESGLRKTVAWYLENSKWTTNVRNSERYSAWLSANYDRRPSR